MKKKILLISVAVILVIAAIAGVSLAYLTDRDSAENVFTFGNVTIQLNEDFEDNELIPGKKIKKEATIENIGKNDAYVWLTIAVPAALDDEDASLNVVHFNFPGKYWLGYNTNSKYYEEGEETTPDDECWDLDTVAAKENVEIDGVVYNVYTALYNGVLAAGEETNTGLSQVYLDPHVDIDPDGDLYWVANGTATAIDWNIENMPSILVSAYAIQADGFDTAAAAYAAYQTQWGDNGAEYSATVLPEEPTATPDSEEK